MKTSTEIVRETIKDYVENMTTQSITQKELKAILKEKLGEKVATNGVLAGTLSKYNSTGGLLKPIQNVEVIREGSKVAYRHKKDSSDILENEFATKLLEATEAFEDALKIGVLSVNFVDLEQDERKLLYRYTEKLQEMKNLFYI